MAIKKYNPTTPARRGMTTEDYSEITTRKPLNFSGFRVVISL